jgi:hypothetical protein
MGYSWGTGQHTHLITCECGRVLQITGTTTVIVITEPGPEPIEWSEPITGDGTGTPLPEVPESAYGPGAVPLEIIDEVSDPPVAAALDRATEPDGD